MHRKWKTIKKGEYLYARIPDHPNATSTGYVLEHRAVMEEFLGRFLTRSEIVHHVDENKHNNCITNLRLTTYSNHRNIHKTLKKMMQCICPNCKISFIRRPKGKDDIGRTFMCSRKCNGEYQRKRQLAC